MISCKQRTPAWFRARAGVVTASQFNRIMTPKTLERSKSDEAYLNELLAEYLLGRPLEDKPATGWRQRGTNMEQEALGFYEADRGIEVTEVGFIVRDDGRVGCSPDGLVGEDGGLEMKVPDAQTHVGYLRAPQTLVDEYRGQVQGGLLISGREWWDCMSYNSELPAVIKRVYPDEKYRQKFGTVLEEFLFKMEQAKGELSAVRELILSNPFSDASHNERAKVYEDEARGGHQCTEKKPLDYCSTCGRSLCSVCIKEAVTVDGIRWCPPCGARMSPEALRPRG